jgi:Zn-dependent peptidase ImmA (M78 family)
MNAKLAFTAEQEVQANIFASELLMPTVLARPQFTLIPALTIESRHRSMSALMVSPSISGGPGSAS